MKLKRFIEKMVKLLLIKMIEQLAQQRAVQLRWRAATQIHRLNHLTSFIFYLTSILHLPA